jgi:hypothetical protein
LKENNSVFSPKQTSGSGDALQAVSTTEDDEIEAAQVESEENAGDDEAMLVEEEKTAEDALPGGTFLHDKVFET